MIEKQKVLRIISENAQIMMEKQREKSTVEESRDLSLDDLVMSSEEKKLFLFIEALPRDELLDLIALMAYGKEHCLHGDMAANYEEFQTIREGIVRDHSNQAPSHTASYLLSITRLNEYLQYALPLYDDIAKRKTFTF